MAEVTGRTTGVETTEDSRIIPKGVREEAKKLADLSGKKPEGEIGGASYTGQPTPDEQLGRIGAVGEAERTIAYDGASARAQFLRKHESKIDSILSDVHARYGRDLNGGSLYIYGNPSTGEVIVQIHGLPTNPQNAEKARLSVETSLSDVTFPLVRNSDGSFETDLVEIRHHTPIG